MKNIFRNIFNLTQRNSLLTIVGIIVTIVSLIAIFFTFNQVSNEEERLTNDIQYRSSLLGHSLKESVEPNFLNKSEKYLQSVVERFTDKQRIAGLAIVDNTGRITAVSSSLPKNILESQQLVTDVMDSDVENGDFTTFDNKKMYIFATPLHDKKTVVGSLIIVQNASYINNRLIDIWKNTFIRLLAQTLLISIAVLFVLRWVILRPLQSLVLSLQDLRLNRYNKNTQNTSVNPIFGPIMKEVSGIQQSLIQARLAATEEARLSLEKIDTPWTAERLTQFTHDLLKNRKIISISSLEPYIHSKRKSNISYHIPASGLITSIEPVMRACKGTWVAHGGGSADSLVVDKNDMIQVPPDDPPI